MNKILGLFVSGLILNGCSQANTIQPIITPIKTSKVSPTSATTKAINWSKIDKADKNIVINNHPSTNQTQFDDVILSAVMGNNVSKSQAIRILRIQNALNQEGVVETIKKQLGDDFAFVYGGFATPDGKGMTLESPSANDGDVIKNYRLVIMTKPNVKAEIHDYIFTTGDAKGLSLPIQILPTAKRTADEIVAIYGDEKMSLKMRDKVASYGGDLQSMGLGIMQKVDVLIYFPNGRPNEVTLLKLEQELEQMTDLDIRIEELQGRIVPL